MKRRIILKLFAVSVWFLPLISFAQFEDLSTLLEGKEKFSEITATVEQYMATIPDSYEKERYQKRFARWAYYTSLHLGPEGEFVNVAQRTFDAVATKEEVFDPSLSWNGNWSFIGPSSTNIDNPGADINGLGRVDRIAFHPSNASIFYIGTPAGGLWKTTNGGSTWIPLADFIPSIAISGIVVSHADPNTIYVLTGDGDAYNAGYFVVRAGYHKLSVGVLVSHDGGDTWEQTGQLFNGDYAGYRLVQHPTDANILLAATSEGIYRTTNGGDTWVRERTGKHYDIEFKPGDPSRIYASGVGEFVYSTDTGNTWNTNATFDYALCAGGRVEIAVTQASGYPHRVYLLAGPKTIGNTFCGFYLSYDSGLSFTRQSNSPNVLGKEDGTGDQSGYDMGLAVSPTNQNIVIAAGLVTYRSTNSGSTFTNATIYRENGVDPYIHPDIHGVEYNPTGGNLYAFGDGGIHKSTNDGVSYTDIYNGVETSQFYGMDDYDANQYAILAGCQDNGVKYKTGSGSAFKHIYCCDAADAIINYNDVTKGYAVVNNWVLRYTSFTGSSPSFIFQPGYFPEIEMNSSNPDIMYVGYSRIRKFNAGVDQGLLGGTGIKGWWALKTCPSNSNKIYAAGGDSFDDATGDMFMSADGGVSWSTVSNNTGWPASYNRISDIGVRPTNSTRVWVTFSGYTDGVKVYYSNDSGSNWYDRSYDLPNIPVWSVEVDANNNVYIGTDYGVFYLASGSTNWEPYYNQLPNVPVTELAINEGSDQLLASTFGRGIWKSTLRDPCPADRTILVDIDGHDFRSASNSITMTGNIVGGEGTQVYMRAGNYVDLKPGFKADGSVGNEYQAYIGNCGSGIPPDFSFGNPSDTNNINTDFKFTLNRNLGTLEIADVSVTKKKAIVRLFDEQTAKIKVFMTDEMGKFIQDIAQFEGAKGESEYAFATDGLKPGMYYLYLGVNKEVNHLQELYIP
ncbi:MAG: hypothetical protein L3J66_06405 [Bacteroidales bacterium]|nr:hypothetical protein [Bacteroidales bacterium]